MVKGLVRAGLRKRPHPRRCGLADTPRCLGLGLPSQPSAGGATIRQAQAITQTCPFTTQVSPPHNPARPCPAKVFRPILRHSNRPLVHPVLTDLNFPHLPRLCILDTRRSACLRGRLVGRPGCLGLCGHCHHDAFLTAPPGQPASMHHSAHGRYHALYQQLYSEAEGAGEAARDLCKRNWPRCVSYPATCPKCLNI